MALASDADSADFLIQYLLGVSPSMTQAACQACPGVHGLFFAFHITVAL